MRQIHHFHLGELVLADQPARVLAGGPGLGTETGRLRAIPQGQGGLFQDLVAVQVGQRHFRRGDQEEVPRLQPEEILLELGQLPRAGHGLAVDHERRSDFDPPFGLMNVEVKIHERPLKPRGPAPGHGKAASRQLDPPLEIQPAQSRAQLPMRPDRKIKGWNRPPAADFHVVALVRAFGHAGVRNVGHGQHPVGKFGLDRFRLSVQGGDPGGKGGKLGDARFGIAALALQPRHFAGGAVALGLQGFHLGQQGAPPAVKFLKRLHAQL